MLCGALEGPGPKALVQDSHDNNVYCVHCWVEYTQGYMQQLVLQQTYCSGPGLQAQAKGLLAAAAAFHSPRPPAACTDRRAAPRAAKAQPALLGQRMLGRVKRFSEANGFGFIVCDQLIGQYENDVFLGGCERAQTGEEPLPLGTLLTFELSEDSVGRPKACRLRRADSSEEQAWSEEQALRSRSEEQDDEATDAGAEEQFLDLQMEDLSQPAIPDLEQKSPDFEQKADEGWVAEKKADTADEGWVMLGDLVDDPCHEMLSRDCTAQEDASTKAVSAARKVWTFWRR